MNKIAYCYLLVLMMAVGSDCKAPDFYTMLSNYFLGWVQCQSGFIGMTPAQDAAAMKCQMRGNITDFPCFYSCWRHETRAVVNGKWNPPEAEKNMLQMWDKDYQIQAKKWYDLVHECVKDYETKTSWPTDYTGNCSSQAVEDGKKCAHDNDVCPPF